MDAERRRTRREADQLQIELARVMQNSGASSEATLTALTTLLGMAVALAYPSNPIAAAKAMRVCASGARDLMELRLARGAEPLRTMPPAGQA